MGSDRSVLLVRGWRPWGRMGHVALPDQTKAAPVIRGGTRAPGMAAAAILQRSAEVRQLGANLSLFELLLWGEVAQCRVILLLGARELDVRAECGVDLPPVPASVTHYFAGVVLRARQWLAVVDEYDILRVNHYVIGLRSEEVAAIDPGMVVPALAKEAAALAGWRLLATAAQGDCCVDCMAYWSGRPRTLETYADIRLHLAEFAASVAEAPPWQAAFRHCAEGPGQLAGFASAGMRLPLGPPAAGGAAAALPAEGVQAMSPTSFAEFPPAAPSEAAALSTPSKRPRTGCRSPSPRGDAAAVQLAEPASASPSASAAALPDTSPADLRASPLGTPVAAAGRAGFRQWLLGWSEEERLKRTRSYAAFVESQSEFAAAVPARKPSAVLAERGPRAVHRAIRLRERFATGVAYLAWRQKEGKESAAPLVEFMRTQRRYAGRVPKRDTQWLSRCAQLAASGEHGDVAMFPRGACGGKRPPTHEARTLAHSLVRRRLRQGPPAKCPVLRERLWDWFVDIRASVASRVSPRLMLAKARQLAEQVLQEQKKTHAYEPMPVLDKHWLLRFKRDKGIVFRRPNMRFKCSKSVLLGRLRAVWRNTIAARRLAEHFLSTDLAHAFLGIDEKPLPL